MPRSKLPEKLYTCEQSKALDQTAIQAGEIPGIVLMERAGRAAFDQLLSLWPESRRLIVYCGGGNNGGDGYIVAALALQHGMDIQVKYLCAPEELKGDAMLAFEIACKSAVPISAWKASSADEFTTETVLVDALLGTGFSGNVRTDYAAAIGEMNANPCPVFAIDLPSGLSGDTGACGDAVVQAAATISFIGLKRGLLTGRGPAFSGQVFFDGLSVPASVLNGVSSVSRIGLGLYQLPKLDADAHKGHRGHVLLVGGDNGFGGAIIMAAHAAARTGAGLISVATRPNNVSALLTRMPEVMVNEVAGAQDLRALLEKASAVVVGPGLGRSAWSEQLLQPVLQSGLPLVLDADALNLVASHVPSSVNYPKEHTWVLTPHPGEAARLLNCSITDIQADRFSAVQSIAQKYHAVVILKGAGTLIATRDQLVVADVGSVGMAVAGMGDILSGIVGALLAQGLSPWQAACIGVCLHGEAGMLVTQKHGLRGVMATDLLPYVRQLVNAM
ncbi:MAG: bifunctional ADP-dependent NAD(P)H-hydrate dehydratase/NAD(P)H-hydrate epimerase [Alteromonadaceae bacterium]|nr:MAG: bifunctional ADP-dependent NAD(P)H-hydrate dehydratase/NAD(P)H-hydrate epimerase [Alteromonadaceae bacterium]